MMMPMDNRKEEIVQSPTQLLRVIARGDQAKLECVSFER